MLDELGSPLKFIPYFPLKQHATRSECSTFWGKVVGFSLTKQMVGYCFQVGYSSPVEAGMTADLGLSLIEVSIHFIFFSHDQPQVVYEMQNFKIEVRINLGHSSLLWNIMHRCNVLRCMQINLMLIQCECNMSPTYCREKLYIWWIFQGNLDLIWSSLFYDQ